jgi:hypothetical protein
MSLKKEVKDRLKALNFDVEKLEAAIKDDKEVDYAIPDGTLLTDAQLTERDAQKLKDGKKEGEKEAINIAKSELKKHTGLELKGERFGDIGEEIKNAINATSDTKIKTLQEQNTALIADNEKHKTEVAQAKSMLENGLFEVEIMGKLPPHPAGLSPKETLELIKMRGYSFEKGADGQPIPTKNGEALKDAATHAPLPLDVGITTIFKEQKWEVAPAGGGGGRGGGDSNPGAGKGIKTQSAAITQWRKDNPDGNPVSPECTSYVAAIAKDDPTFDWRG